MASWAPLALDPDESSRSPMESPSASFPPSSAGHAARMIAPSARIVFLDVDGTIIDHDGTIPASAIEAIGAARANGHLVLLSTGRSSQEVDPRLERIGLDGAVLAAGAFVRFHNQWVLERTMPEGHTRRMIGVFDELGIEYTLQARDAVYPTAGRHEYLRRLLEIDNRADLRASVDDQVVLAESAPLDRIAKAVFFGDRLDAYDLVRSALAADGFSVITGTIPHLGTGGGEVALAGVTKGSAILALLERLGIPAIASIGIGDNSNDIEMLQVTGVGIAMGNGTPEAKAAADEETGTVGEGGVAQAFARHGLI